MSKIKLSQAIREGAKLRPQGFGYSFSNANGKLCSCAWGAAHEAITGKHCIDPIIGAVMYKTHDKECEARIENPETHRIYDLPSVITDLNDHSKWTREQIADWLELQGF